MTLILRPYENNVLVPVPKREWREPSRAMPKDQFGRPDQVRFSITARLHDGYVRWKGWFDDRDDADAFMYALMRHEIIGDPMPRELWDLPTPAWGPWIDEVPATYQLLTNVFLTTGAGTGNQTYNVPSDWTAVNTLQTVGAGGSGGVIQSFPGPDGGGTGGAGGAWNQAVNVALTPGGTTTYNVGAGGAAVTRSTAGVSTGNSGGDVFFGGTTLAGSSVGSKAGSRGRASITATQVGTTGASGAAGVGSSNHDGGGSGTASTGGCSGGGGAAGGTANGVASANGDGNINFVSDGGNGDGGSGGAGSAGGITISSSNGSPGTEWDATHGSGGGSGGAGVSGNGNSGDGGNYGAGTGGMTGNGTVSSGNGAQGAIYLQYTPGGATSVFAINLAMMGM